MAACTTSWSAIREAHVVASEAPFALERVDVGHDETEAGLVAGGGLAGGQWEVVAAERVLREEADHRPGLHAEQHGSEHLEHAAAERNPRGESGHRRGVGELVVVFCTFEIALHRVAEGRRHGFQHGAERDEVELDPALRSNGAQRRSKGGGEPGLGDDERLRGPREILELVVVVL